MSKRTRFTQAEVTRAVRAAESAGLFVTGVRIDDSGFTIMTDGARANSALDLNQAASILDQRLGVSLNGDRKNSLLSR